MTTARFAGEQGREVFAIPGHPLDPRAEGTNQLLKTGATLVTEANDVFEALEPIAKLGTRSFREFAPPAAALSAPPEAIPDPSQHDREAVLSALGPHPIDIDEIGRATGLGIRAVRVVLMELDLSGRIERHGVQLVSLISGPGHWIRLEH